MNCELGLPRVVPAHLVELAYTALPPTEAVLSVILHRDQWQLAVLTRMAVEERIRRRGGAALMSKCGLALRCGGLFSGFTGHVQAQQVASELNQNLSRVGSAGLRQGVDLRPF